MEKLPPVGSEKLSVGQSPEIVQADFDDYRRLCDSYDSYRKVGCLDPEKYQALVNDPNTIGLEINGQSYPLLAPLKYVDGYNEPKCRELTDRQSIFLLATPPSLLLHSESRVVLPQQPDFKLEDAAIIIEKNESDSEEEIEELTSKLSSLGSLKRGEFIDSRIDQEDKKNAAMELYSFKFSPNEELNAPGRQGIYDGWKIYEQTMGKSSFYPHNPEGVRLYSHEEIINDRALIDNLWAITSRGFGEILSEFHPVLMEEDKDFFESQITHDSAYTAVRYHKGVPVCFSTVTDDIDSCEWLNFESSSLQALKSDLDLNDLYYFSDVISDSSEAQIFSFDVMKLLLYSRLATNSPTTVIYETTNLSSIYINYLAQRTLVRNPDIKTVAAPYKIDQMNYFYLRT